MSHIGWVLRQRDAQTFGVFEPASFGASTLVCTLCLAAGHVAGSFFRFLLFLIHSHILALNTSCCSTLLAWKLRILF